MNDAKHKQFGIIKLMDIHNAVNKLYEAGKLLDRVGEKEIANKAYKLARETEKKG